MNKARIREHIAGYDLAAQVYWLGDGGFGRSAVSLPGLPSATTMDAITPLLCRWGYGVVQPQYIGTYDSDGDPFTPESAVRSVSLVQELVKTGKLHDLRGDRFVDSGRIVEVMAAHSFGTFVAMKAILQGLRPRIAVMLSPMFEFGKRSGEVGLTVDWRRHVDHMARALPLTFRMNDTKRWYDFFATAEHYQPDPATVVGSDTRVRIYCIVGEKDTSLIADKSRRYVEKFVGRYPTVLEFAGFRTIPGAGHDAEELLTADAEAELRNLVA